MTTPARQTSRWGSFLQQALDGVESRLDNILVGDGPVEQPAVAGSGSSTTIAKPETGPPRNAPVTNATNDRLQERLARAIAAKKYASQRPDSHTSSNVPSRVGSPITSTETPRKSLDNLSVGSQDKQSTRSSIDVQKDELQGRTTLGGVNDKEESNDLLSKTGETEAHRLSIESGSTSIGGQIRDLPTTPDANTLKAEVSMLPDGKPTEIGDAHTAPYKVLNNQQQEDLEISDLQRQEEIHGYIERIDALQAKLQYLSRESAESARKAAASASTGSTEKKLALKDEQIALLMEEGQKLSKAELKYMTIIKKLRTSVSESEKEASELKQKLEKVDKEKADILERLTRTDALERQLVERQKFAAQLQKEIDTIIVDRDAKDLVVAKLKAQLQDSASQAKAFEVKAVQDQFAIQKSRITELENDVASLKIEKELAAGRAKAQLDEIRAKSEREAERARVAEVEMRAEQQMLEGRLELMRTRAEEVSSGATSDAQAKLLRQIETLQSQYAVASENWQGIEASLVAQVKNLEKERDEAMKKESDIRRRARDATLKTKEAEEQLEDTRSKIRALHQEVNERQESLLRLKQRAEEAESALLDARKVLEQEKQTWKGDMQQQRIEDDRSKWREDLATHSPFGIARAESPAPLSHRNLTADLLGLQNLQTRSPARSFTNDLTTIEGRISRKSSAQQGRSSGQRTPQRQDSAQAILNGDVSELPPIHAAEHDDYFDHVVSPSPTHQTIQDVLSVSTVGAGPSVQLVERMSAAVRRLESEKVSTKEELRRLAGQRDEARAQIVALMQEVEAKKALDFRLKTLEEENKKINSRYQTTLEMLGEKSELVEELKADVQDVKDMYRELVERTIK